MQVTNEEKIYSNDTTNFLSFIISTISKENVENVVKEPKIPIIKKYFIIFEEIFLYSIYPIIKPIKNDPRMFIIKVPIGRFGKIYLKEFVVKNLSVAPTAPPAATHNKLIKFFTDFLLLQKVFFQ